nr:uncharacterized protein LOC129264270 [Lytechinus pictus]XP_054758094.1 uncharacterized protein LOC129264270 [Lytechinus pictus]
MMSQANTLKPRSMLRKRLPRYKFESSDRTLLQNLVNKYIGILERKAINQNMLDEKKRAWQLITQKFNSQSVDKRIRDAKQLRKCWENMKWRARREVKQADIEEDMSSHNGHHLSDFTHPSHLTSGMMGVGEFMGGSVEQDDEEEEDDNEGEFDDDDDEEEMVAPMGTEPIEISDDLDHLDATETDGNLPLPLTTPHGDPRHPNGLPISHPPDDELIGSFVADAWIAEEAPGEDGDREDIHLQTEIGDASQENQIWNGSTSPVGGMGGGASTSSSTRHTHTPPLAASDTSQDRIPRAPSVSSSMGDAAESLSSRHSISSSSRNNKRPRDKVYTNQSNAHQPRRPSSSASPVVLLDGDGESSAIAERRSSVEEAERQMRTDEDHGKRMELLQAQLDFEKSKVERMRRMMEMSEIEHRARMRMLVRYQQVAEKQKEYWSHHVDTVKRDEVTDQF